MYESGRKCGRKWPKVAESVVLAGYYWLLHGRTESPGLPFSVFGRNRSRNYKGGPGINLSLKLCVVEKNSFSETCSERENSALQVKILISARYLP